MYPKDLPNDLVAVIVVQYRFGILAGGHRYGNDHVAVTLTFRTAYHAPDRLNYVDRGCSPEASTSPSSLSGSVTHPRPPHVISSAPTRGCRHY